MHSSIVLVMCCLLVLVVVDARVITRRNTADFTGILDVFPGKVLGQMGKYKDTASGLIPTSAVDSSKAGLEKQLEKTGVSLPDTDKTKSEALNTGHHAKDSIIETSDKASDSVKPSSSLDVVDRLDLS